MIVIDVRVTQTWLVILEIERLIISMIVISALTKLD